MSTELSAATLSVLLAGGGWFLAERLLNWLTPEPPSHQTRGGPGEITLTTGVFVVSFGVFLVTLAIGIAVLGIEHEPSENARDSFHEFLSGAAQVLVGLFIALAIALHDRGWQNVTSEARSDALQLFVCIVLGEGLSLAALFPDAPAVVFSAALITVPAAIAAALVGIALLAFSRTTDSQRGP